MEGMRELVDKLNRYAYQYYVLDEPTIADVEYDRLYDQLLAMEKESGVVLADSPTVRVGGQPLSKFESVRHLGRLYSLDKCQSKEELRAWLEKLKNADGKLPTCSLEYKYDGLTINLTYENGELVRGATRGNGVEGEDVTAQVKTIKSVPLKIDYKGVLEVQGEGIMRLSELEKYNAREGVTPLKNARNGVAGAIRNLDPKVTAERNLEVNVYNVNFIDKPFESGSDMIKFLRDNKFRVSGKFELYDDIDDIIAGVDAIGESRDSLDFLIDGAVIKVDDVATRERLGFTEKFPRWAMAFKYPAQEATTIVKDVVWQVSRTGKLNPLAILEPVELAGVTVSRATLNNYSEILRKDIKIGSRVFVRRSNDVIPEIMGVAEHYPNSKEIEKPTVCPACGSPVEWQGAFVKCTNYKNCVPAVVSALTHFVSKEAMNIEGLSEKTIETLMEEGVLSSFVDIYRLEAEDFEGIEGFKETKINNILTAIDNSKNTTLSRLIFALGIANIGKKASKQLAEKFGSMENLQKAKVDDLTAIEDFGEIMAKSVIDYFASPEHVKAIEELYSLGVKIKEEEVKSGAMTGLVVVLTGSLPTLKRSQAKQLIEEHGGKTADNVSKAVNLVVAGEDAGSKLDKATKLGIKIIDETELLAMIGEK
ncbi:MAG: NAD-dependent DNA ligase LigA [Christensenellales bacterium]